MQGKKKYGPVIFSKENAWRTEDVCNDPTTAMLFPHVCHNWFAINSSGDSHGATTDYPWFRRISPRTPVISEEAYG
jgi:hypothetical protein